MSMSRKDYLLIASAFSRVYQVANEQPEMNHSILLAVQSGIRASALAVANSLSLDNSSFDWDRFMEACGVEYPESTSK